MEIALWTAIGASLGLIAKGASEGTGVDTAKIDEVLKNEIARLKEENLKLQDSAKAAEERAGTIAELQGILKKRTVDASKMSSELTAAETIWSRASSDDIREFARRQLEDLSQPEIVPTAPPAEEPPSVIQPLVEEEPAISQDQETNEEPVVSQDEKINEEPVVGVVDEPIPAVSPFDTSSGTAPVLPQTEEDNRAMVGGGSALTSLYTRLQTNPLAYNPITRGSLTSFHTKLMEAAAKDGIVLGDDKTLAGFARNTAASLVQIAREREDAKREATDNEKAMKEAEKASNKARGVETAKSIEAESLRKKLAAARSNAIAMVSAPRSQELEDAIAKASDLLRNSELDNAVSIARTTSGEADIDDPVYTNLILRYPDEKAQWNSYIQYHEELPPSGPQQGEAPITWAETRWKTSGHVPGIERAKPSPSLNSTSVDALRPHVLKLLDDLARLSSETSVSSTIPSQQPISSTPSPVETEEIIKQEVDKNLTSIHDSILTQTPIVLAAATRGIKTLETIKKTLNSKLKLLPSPYLFYQGCAAKTVAVEIVSVSSSVLQLLSRAVPILERELKAYKKETKDLTIYNTTFQRNPSSQAEFDRQKATIDEKVASLNAEVDAINIQSLFETSRQMRGGGQDPMDGIRERKMNVELKTYAIQSYLKFVDGFEFAANKMAQKIDDIIRQEPFKNLPESAKRCSDDPEGVEVIKEEIKREDPSSIRIGNPLTADIPETAFRSNAIAPSSEFTLETNPLFKRPIPSFFPEETPEQKAQRDAAISAMLPAATAERNKAISETSTPFFKNVDDLQEWFNTVWIPATPDERKQLTTQRKEALALLESIIPESRRNKIKSRGKVGGATEEEMETAEKLYTALLEGASRKRTLKNRRGGKQTQNGRGTRRRKNSANRSHSYSR